MSTIDPTGTVGATAQTAVHIDAAFRASVPYELVLQLECAAASVSARQVDEGERDISHLRPSLTKLRGVLDLVDQLARLDADGDATITGDRSLMQEVFGDMAHGLREGLHSLASGPGLWTDPRDRLRLQAAREAGVEVDA